MRKAELRAYISERRKALSLEFIEEKSQEICSAFIQLYPDKSLTVCAYAALLGEVNTCEILKYYQNVYLPVTVGSEINFYKHTGVLHKGGFGVLEPEQKIPLTVIPDAVIVPGVGFDERGNRAGYGKGFYDRFFAREKHVPKTAFAFEFQVINEITDVLETDVRMNRIITEKRMIQCMG